MIREQALEIGCPSLPEGPQIVHDLKRDVIKWVAGQRACMLCEADIRQTHKVQQLLGQIFYCEHPRQDRNKWRFLKVAAIIARCRKVNLPPPNIDLFNDDASTRALPGKHTPFLTDFVRQYTEAMARDNVFWANPPFYMIQEVRNRLREMGARGWFVLPDPSEQELEDCKYWMWFKQGEIHFDRCGSGRLQGGGPSPFPVAVVYYDWSAHPVAKVEARQFDDKDEWDDTCYMPEADEFRDAVENGRPFQSSPEVWNPTEQDVLVAKLREIAKIRLHGVVTSLHRTQLPPGANLMSHTWVLRNKLDDEAEWEVRARLVARGFQDKEKNLDTFAPTIREATIRLALVRMMEMDWGMQALDVSSAFHQGDELTERKHPVYMWAPKEACEGKGAIWRLDKALYGLRDAPKAWWLKLTKVLLNMGLVPSELDPGMFVDKDGKGVVLAHVDDLLMLGEQATLDRWDAQMSAELVMGTAKKGDEISYLGLEIKRVPEGIRIFNKVKSFQKMEQNVSLQTHVSILCTLQYLAGQTRADFAFAASSLNRAGISGHDLKALKTYVTYMQKHPFKGLLIPRLKSVDCFVCFTDATYTHEASVTLIQGTDLQDNHRWIPITWRSHLMGEKTRSTMIAELHAAQEGDSESGYMQLLWGDIDSHDTGPVTWCTDCMSLFQSIKAPMSQLITQKKFQLEVNGLRRAERRGKIVPTWVPSEQNLADGLTKAMSTKVLKTVLETAEVPKIFRDTCLMRPCPVAA